jgi:hypothetical protein
MSGTGTKLFEKEEAQRLAAELSADFPNIDHDAVIPAPPANEPQIPTSPTPGG